MMLALTLQLNIPLLVSQRTFEHLEHLIMLLRVVFRELWLFK